MFTEDMKESSKSKFEIKDWSYEAFVAMIEFFYSANLSDYIPLKIIIELLSKLAWFRKFTHEKIYRALGCLSCLQFEEDLPKAADAVDNYGKLL